MSQVSEHRTAEGRRRHRPLTAAMVTSILALVACSSGDDSDSAPTTSPPATETTVPPDAHTEDGVLTIGVLLPRSGPGGSLGEALIDVVLAAVDSINSGGGVLGQPIVAIPEDEGTDRSTAEAAIAAMVAKGADAIIGPGSSNIAVGVAPAIVNAGVMACSPLATSLLLSDLPDNGLVVRTIPGDDLQAEAIARTIDGTGFGEVSLVLPDDIYGRTFGAAIRTQLARRGPTSLNEVPYSATAADFDAIAENIAQDAPPVVALIASSDNAVRLLAAIDEQYAGRQPPLIVVNDSMRNADVTPLVASSSPALKQLSGVSLQPYRGAIDIRTLLGLEIDQATPAFAAAAVDCVNLLALTARQAGVDDPIAMARLVQPTTSGGTGCGNYITCSALLDQGRDINYDGPSGLLSIDDRGDVRLGEFVTFAFDDDGRDVTINVFAVGSE